MAYTVTFISNYIASLIKGDIHLRKVAVEGELSNISSGPGYTFFTLKDKDAALSGIIFSSSLNKGNYTPKEGDKVIVSGSIETYTKTSKYQIKASKIEPVGQGDLYKRFLELKDDLEERGMFDPGYKKEIPKYISTLGVVTSPTGAAVRDIINITKRRNSYVSIILCPALVQGEYAAESIARGIRTLDEMGVDLIIAGRGGGSIEDLWAFNEEVVAKAIFSSATPIISAVGHETDYTIADFVADLRAPTPSAAAELGVYSVEDLWGELSAIERRLNIAISGNIDSKRQKALSLGRHLSSLSPEGLIRAKRQSLIQYGERFNIAMQSAIFAKREQMKRAAAALSALSPAVRLSQGYSYVTDTKGKNVYSIKDVEKGDELNIRVADGDIRALVSDKSKG